MLSLAVSSQNNTSQNQEQQSQQRHSFALLLWPYQSALQHIGEQTENVFVCAKLGFYFLIRIITDIINSCGISKEFWIWVIYRDRCSSAARAGQLMIGRLLVQIPALGWAELHVVFEQVTEPKIAPDVAGSPCDELATCPWGTLSALTKRKLGLAQAQTPATP